MLSYKSFFTDVNILLVVLVLHLIKAEGLSGEECKCQRKEYGFWTVGD